MPPTPQYTSYALNRNHYPRQVRQAAAGHYHPPHRIHSLIRRHTPTLPDFIDEPAPFVDNLDLDPDVLSSDLLINYSLNPDITPEIVKRAAIAGARAVIIPGGRAMAGDP
ncbi:MAG: DUF166 domain-containing protein, partial [Methanosarcinales archaeon]|nr:DUF166 domain-containing protein [Methanosarcinales archaeon]